MCSSFFGPTLTFVQILAPCGIMGNFGAGGPLLDSLLDGAPHLPGVGRCGSVCNLLTAADVKHPRPLRKQESPALARGAEPNCILPRLGLTPSLGMTIDQKPTAKSQQLIAAFSTFRPCRRRGRRALPVPSSLPESRRPALRWSASARQSSRRSAARCAPLSSDR